MFGSILQSSDVSSVWLGWLYFGVRSLLCALMSSKGSRLSCDLLNLFCQARLAAGETSCSFLSEVR